MLAAGAGAVGAALLRPVVGLAAARATAPRLSERWLGEVPSAGRTVALPSGADLLGLEWDGAAGALLQLRLLAPNGAWGPWASAAGCCSGEPSAATTHGRVIGSPVWTAGAVAVALRATRALSGVRLHLIDTSGGFGERRAALARSLLGAGVAGTLATIPPNTPEQPPIVARAAWARGIAHPRVAPGYGTVRIGFVHHTENPNGYLASEVPAMLAAIFLYHRDVRGWNDIGYNFVIDAFGRIFEARAGGIDEPVVGAHAGGFNLESTGVAVLGSFSSQSPPAPALRSLRALLAWKLSLHGVPARGRVRVRVNPAGAVYSRFPAGAHVSLPHIAGHRDGDSTDCPGDAFYARLGAIRSGVHRLAPNPTRATLALTLAAPVTQAPTQTPAGPAPGEQSPAGTAQTPFALRGSLASVQGAPVAGAAILLQVRSVSARGEVVRERAVAEVSTDASGAWSLTGAASASVRGKPASLRALYRAVGGRAGAGCRGVCPAGGAGRGHCGACRRAHSSSVAASVAVSPRSGEVLTSSVGAPRAAAHSWHAGLNASSIQASGRSPTNSSTDSSFQCAAVARPGPAAGRPKAMKGRPAGTPSRRGRCSSAFSSQPLAHTSSNECDRRRR
ncbi:MAG TPA: N-acetylmuramoyl-L-alanine amidase [Solirubrobacteraceae bacterium]|nr:N-acetylmuramoyl-L-alanine amidase [Solirubrobacteraceae bacterium]